MQIIQKKIDDIKPYEKNPRKNDGSVEYVKNSIKEFGFKVPIIIDKDSVIVCGHTRYKAAKQLNMQEVPCIMADDLTEEQIKAFRIADNKVGEFSEWDMDLLGLELDDITDIDMGLFGIDTEEKKGSRDNKEPEEDDYDEPIPAMPKSMVGDIYELGDHRLMCGDSTNIDHVKALMGEEKCDLFLTDPPYGVSIGTKNEIMDKLTSNSNSIKENIKGDTMTIEQLANDIWKDAFDNAYQVAEDCCSIYFSMAQGISQTEAAAAAAAAAWTMKHQLIWVKNAATFSLGRLDYDYKHEPIWYGWKKTHKFYAHERDEYMTSILEQDPLDIDKMTEKEAKKILRRFIDNNRETTCILENKPLKSPLHPTMKPVKLWGRLIKNSTKPGDRVLDLFGGSGTTVIACEQLDRRAFVMEFDPRYVDVIIDRWEEFTGQSAKYIGNIQEQAGKPEGVA